MASGLKVSTVFTAVDKFSGQVKKMSNSMEKFSEKAERGISKAERGFRKLTPTLSGASKQFLSFATAAAASAAIVGGISFSFKSMMDYENAIASAQAITGSFGDDFKVFEDQIQRVGKAQKVSAVEIAKGFEIVGSAAPELLKNADALGEVTEAAIVLSKASGDDLASSAQNLTGVMNQFSLTGGADARRTMDALAAGAKFGSANITRVGESMKNVGSVASSANISMEDTVALVETLGKFSLFGAEAGTKLRGVILKLQKSGVGYASGQFEINDALGEAKKQMEGLATAKEKDAFLNKMFGAENVSTGKILLNNTKLFGELSKNINGASVAQEQADARTNTLSGRLNELKASWVNMLTGSGAAGKGLEKLKKVIEFLTKNLDTIVSVVLKVIAVFGIIKGALLVARGAMMAFSVATKIVAAAQWLLSIALNANPIGLVVIAVAALAAGYYALSQAISFSTTEARLAGEVSKRAKEATLDQRVEVTMLFSALRRAEQGSDAYNKTLERLEQIQPGIIEQYNLTVKSLEQINKAEKDLTASILKRARAEARAEMIKEKFKEAQELRDEGPGFALKAAGFIAEKMSFGLLDTGKMQAEMTESRAAGLEREAEILAEQQAAEDLETVNPQASASESITTKINENKETLTIDFKNMPEGVNAFASSGANFSAPGLGTTNF